MCGFCWQPILYIAWAESRCIFTQQYLAKLNFTLLKSDKKPNNNLKRKNLNATVYDCMKTDKIRENDPQYQNKDWNYPMEKLPKIAKLDWYEKGIDLFDERLPRFTFPNTWRYWDRTSMLESYKASRT